jgi:DNA-binding MarR family transcriptional regulator
LEQVSRVCHKGGLLAGLRAGAIGGPDLPAGGKTEDKMAKKQRGTMQEINNAARLGRTMLAARLLRLNLYAGQDQLMLALAEQEGQTPSALAAATGVRPPTVTKTISRLQAQGFLTKTESNEDARQAHIFLTDSGRAAIMGIEKAIRKTEKRALDGFDKKDCKQLAKFLRKLAANLNGESGKDTGGEQDQHDADQSDD